MREAAEIDPRVFYGVLVGAFEVGHRIISFEKGRLGYTSKGIAWGKVTNEDVLDDVQQQIYEIEDVVMEGF